MKLSARLIGSAFALAACLSVASTAHAYTANAYCGISNAQANNTPTAGTAFTGTLCATVTLSQIDFASDKNYTLDGFLTDQGFGTVVYKNGYTLASAQGANSGDNLLLDITGTANFTAGQIFNVTHDDGTNMYVGGQLVLGAPGPTSPTVSTFTYSGPVGNQSFEFIYTECCGAPADYQTNLVPATVTPEPSSLALMGTGVLAAAGAVRRRIVR